jgi:hypothetical protein
MCPHQHERTTGTIGPVEISYGIELSEYEVYRLKWNVKKEGDLDLKQVAESHKQTARMQDLWPQ